MTITVIKCPGCGADIPEQPSHVLSLPAPEPFIHETNWCTGCGGSAKRLGPTLAEQELNELLNTLYDILPGEEDLFIKMRKAIDEVLRADPARPTRPEGV